LAAHLPSTRFLTGYLVLVGLPLLGLLGILGRSAVWPSLDLPAARAASPALSAPQASGVFLLLLQIAVILIVSRLGGRLFRQMGQPQVMGEMFAGIALGPSVLGWIAPGIWGALFPDSSLAELGALSQLGLILFLFLVGLSLCPHEIRAWRRASLLTSHASIIFPFALGSGLALYLYPRLVGSDASEAVFALFMGAAMSITAFPVLARILTERRLVQSLTGTLALACAAVDDVTGWCILAYITVLVRKPQSSAPMWLIVLGCLAFIAVMLCVVRPVARRLDRMSAQGGTPGESVFVCTMLIMLGSALTTEVLGIHVLFGSFLAGAILPKDTMLTNFLRARLESITVLLLLPLFFAFTGLRTHVGLVRGAGMGWILLYVIVVAVAGKMGGSTIAARWSGLNWRDAAAVGVLLNTRGLMELVILNVALDLRIISPALFAMMVIMAFVTTLMTSPLLNMLRPASFPREGSTVLEHCYENELVPAVSAGDFHGRKPEGYRPPEATARDWHAGGTS
jgi:Kef-type K+ transport system membrane component KefB